ncbi:L,D-transpeptidase [Phyllobacterium salinisoli]|uniref:L,D-transpeptidase n=1 Tax=Phyllobacterium salinisoli TaxID=1899321 RepID=A0A368K947_9HYPH|nr:L,D-transpeptidase [Phyllobacterium salinisoli]RCS25869.1 L,D-transpeptidase [Phyllobacterium salinisoli]
MKRLFLVFALALGVCLFSAVDSFASKLVAEVSISDQTMTVSKGGKVLYNWRVSTGREGYETPVGRYRPTRMYRLWHSKTYDNTPMPHSVFFHAGYAIHASNAVKSLGRPASHGCVRLKPANAAKFYDMVEKAGRKNTRIIVQY